jgi:phage tail tape-measure protein
LCLTAVISSQTEEQRLVEEARQARWQELKRQEAERVKQLERQRTPPLTSAGAEAQQASRFVRRECWHKQEGETLMVKKECWVEETVPVSSEVSR